jgi:hypothetical protein
MKNFNYLVLLACLAFSINGQAAATAECSIRVKPMTKEAESQEIFTKFSEDPLFKPRMHPYSTDSRYVVYDFDLTLEENRLYKNSNFTFKQKNKEQFVSFNIHPRLIVPATLNANANEVWVIHFHTTISAKGKEVLNQHFDILVTNDSLNSEWRHFDRSGISNFGYVFANCSLKK